MRTCLLTLVCCVTPALAQVEVEAPDVPTLAEGEPITVAIDAAQPKVDYAFTASEPGVLFVRFRLEPHVACFLEVLDPTGQRAPGVSLCGERDDQAQQALAASLTRPGAYTLRVKRSRGQSPRVTFVARFVPFAAAADDQDPDAASPTEAAPLVLGVPLTQQLGDADPRDWYRVAVTAAGTLVVRVEASSPAGFGVGLSAYRDEPRADEPRLLKRWHARWDHQRRVLRLEGVQPNDVVYLELQRSFGAEPIDYTLRAAVEPMAVEDDE